MLRKAGHRPGNFRLYQATNRAGGEQGQPRRPPIRLHRELPGRWLFLGRVSRGDFFQPAVPEFFWW